MKYGLREDDALRKKENCRWKKVVENEIKNLHTMISALKIDAAIRKNNENHWKKAVQNEVSKIQKEAAVEKKRLEELITKMKCLATNTTTCPILKFTDQSEWYLPAGGTKLFKHNVIYDRWQRSKYCCASIMPEYNDWSLEELRLADYIIDRLPQHCQFVNEEPTWPCSGNASSGVADMKKYQKDNSWPIIPEMASSSTCLDQTEVPSTFEELGVVKKYEELLEKVVSELKDVNKNITSINGRLFPVETNLSEISEQVSVLDSKLHTVDQFITMVNLEKKWHSLKQPCLVSLENTFANNNEDKEVNKLCDENFKLDKIQTSLHDISRKSPVLSVKENELSKNLNLLKSNYPLLHLDSYLISDIDKTKSCNNTSDTSLITSSPIKAENNDLEVPDNCKDLPKTNIQNTGHFEGASIAHLVNSFYGNVLSNSNQDKGDSSFDVDNNCFDESKISSPLNTTDIPNSNEKKDCKTPTQSGTDIESDYVIVGKKDIENIPEDLNEKDFLLLPENLSSSSINQDFQVCSNITEYLEINLGKRKDETYKFAYQARPETSEAIFSPFSDTTTDKNELKINLRFKDDYFNTFFRGLRESNSPETKQSSPLVVAENNSENLTIRQCFEVQESVKDDLFNNMLSELKQNNPPGCFQKQQQSSPSVLAENN